MQKLFVQLADKTSTQLSQTEDSSKILASMASISGLPQEEILFPFKKSQNFELDTTPFVHPEYTGTAADGVVDYIKYRIPNYFTGAMPVASMLPLPPIVVPAPSTSPAFTSGSCKITKALKLGTKDAEVTTLQRFLISKGYLATDNNSGYFGSMTQAALQKWQKANRLVSNGTLTTTGFGVMGPKSRALFAQQCK